MLSNLDKLICEESFENIKESLLAFIEGKSNFKTQYTTKNLLGEKIDILMQWSIPDNNIHHVLISVIDISTRVKAQKLLKQSEIRFRELADFLPVGIFEFDEMGKVTFLNRAAKELGGISGDQINHDNFNPADFLLPENKEKGLLLFDRALKGKALQNVEYDIQRKDNSAIQVIASTSPIYENNKIVGLRGAATDITNLKKIENELRKSEKKYKEIFEKDFSAIIVSDFDGNILECNPAFLSLFGLTSINAAKKINSKSLYLNQEEAEDIRLRLKQNGEIKNYEVTLKTISGEIRYVAINGSTINDENGEVVAIRGYISDLTAKKIAQQKLEKYKNDLEKIVKKRTRRLKKEIAKQKAVEDKMQIALEKEKELNELKTSFISTASHEFRTPLTAIQLYSDLISLSGGESKDSGKLKYINNIQAAVKNMTTMIDDVLTISRTETGKISFNPKILNLHNFVRQIMSEVETVCKVNHKIVFNYRINKESFLLDEKLLRHIFQNLLCNAMKYSPNGGTITLDIYQKNNLIIIAIQDEGIGIAKNELNKLFEPFYRTSNSLSINGTGLGLTIVKHAVELHGGIIRVKSKLKVGTKFYIGLPLKNGKEEKNCIN